MLTEILRKRLNLQKPAFGSMPSAPAGAASIAPSAAACPAAPAAKAEPVKEKTDFEVKLESYSAEGKIRVGGSMPPAQCSMQLNKYMH